MKVHRYSEQQRRQWVYAMQHKLKTVKQICSEAVISRATLYNWLQEFANEKNTTDNGPATAWQPLDKHKMLLAALAKTDKDKTISRKIVSELMKRYTLTAAQACEIAGMEEALYNYRPRKPEAEDRLVYDELLRLIAEDGTRGLDECTAILQQAQPDWTSRQIKRIYRQGRLYLNRTRARNTRLLQATDPPPAIHEYENSSLQRAAGFWQAGLVQGTLNTNTACWVLYIIDYTDGTPLHVAAGEGSITTETLIRFLSLASDENGVPKKMRVVAQPPFNSREVTRWVRENKITLYNLSMAKPENQLEISHLQDSIRQQLLDDTILTIDALQEKAAAWIVSFSKKEALTIFA